MEKYTYLTSEESGTKFLDWLNITDGVRTPLYQKAMPISNDLLKMLEETILEKLMANVDRYPMEHMSKFILIENGSLKMPICEKVIRNGKEQVVVTHYLTISGNPSFCGRHEQDGRIACLPQRLNQEQAKLNFRENCNEFCSHEHVNTLLEKYAGNSRVYVVDKEKYHHYGKDFSVSMYEFSSSEIMLNYLNREMDSKKSSLFLHKLQVMRHGEIRLWFNVPVKPSYMHDE